MILISSIFRPFRAEAMVIISPPAGVPGVIHILPLRGSIQTNFIFLPTRFFRNAF